MADRNISANLVLRLQQWAQAWQQASATGQTALRTLQGETGTFAKASTGHFNQSHNAFKNFWTGVGNGVGGIVKGIGMMTASFASAQVLLMGLESGVRQFVGGAIDFQSQMSTTLGLTSVTQEEMAKVQDRILKLAPAMGKSPNELAEAFYFAASAIDDTDKAIAALEASARASAAGLGDTKTVVDAVTSAMNAYRLGADEADKVTDVLLNTVKYGKMEPTALAGSFGTVLGIANQLNVPLEEVGANLAVLTNIGISCDEAVTSLNSIFSALLKTTPMQAEAFASVGLNAADLRKQLGEEGLYSVLITMLKATEGNDEALAQMIPNIRALRGVLGSAGAQGERYAEILEGIRNGAGATDAAFEHHRKTFEYVASRIKVTLQAAFYTLALKVLPAVSAGLEKFAGGLEEAIDVVGDVMGNFGRYIQTAVKEGDLLNEWLDRLPGPLQVVAVTIAQVIQNVIKIVEVLGDWREQLGGTGTGLNKFAKPLGDVFKALARLEEKFPIVSGLITAFLVVLAVEAVATFAAAVAGLALNFLTFPIRAIAAATGEIIGMVKATAGLVSKTVTITQNIVQTGAEIIRSLPWVYSEVRQNVVRTGQKLITALKDITQTIHQKVIVEKIEAPAGTAKTIGMKMATGVAQGFGAVLAPLLIAGIAAALAAAGVTAAAAAVVAGLVVGAAVIGSLIFIFREQIWTFLKEQWPNILVVGLTGGIGLAVKEFGPKLIEALGNALRAAGEWLSDPRNVGRFLGRVTGAIILAIISPALVALLMVRFRGQIGDFFGRAGDFLRDGFLRIGGTIKDAFGDAIGAAAGAIVDRSGEILGGVGDLLGRIGEAFQKLPETVVSVFTNLPSMTLGALSATGSGVATFFSTTLPNFITGGIPAIVGAAVRGFQNLPSAIMGVLTGLYGEVTGWISNLGSLFTNLMKPWEWIKAAWDGFVQGIKDVLGLIFGSGFIPDWLNRLANYFISFFQPWQWIAAAMGQFASMLISAGEAAIQGFWNGMQAIWGAVAGWVAGIPGMILSALGDLGGLLVGVGQAVIQGLWNGMLATWGAAIGWLYGLPVQMVGAIGEVGDLLWGVGKKIISSLWDGMKSAWGAVSGWLSDIGNKIKGLKGPEEKDRTLLEPHGEAIMEGLQTGMESGFDEVRRYLTAAAGIAAGTVDTGVGQAEPELIRMGRDLANFFGTGIQEAWAFVANRVLLMIGEFMKRTQLSADQFRTMFERSGLAIQDFMQRIARYNALEQLRDQLNDAVAEVDRLRSAFSGLFSKPTREEAELNLRRALLEEQRTQAERERGPGTRELEGRLEGLRDQLDELGEGHESKRKKLEAEIERIEKDIAARQSSTDAIDNEIKAIDEELAVRRAHQDVLRAQLDMADQTLLTDAAQNGAAQWLTQQFGWATAAAAELTNKFFWGALAFQNMMNEIRGWVDALKSATTVAVPMQHGGVVTRPTLALLGEGNKKEVVFPLQEFFRFLRKLPSVASLFSGQALMAATATAGAYSPRVGTQHIRNGHVYYGPVHIHVNGDPQEVVRELNRLLG